MSFDLYPLLQFYFLYYFGGNIVVLLPGLDVLRHYTPRQVLVAVITPGVVEEISPGGEAMTGKPRATLQDKPQANNINVSSLTLLKLTLLKHIVSNLMAKMFMFCIIFHICTGQKQKQTFRVVEQQRVLSAFLYIILCPLRFIL